MCKPIEGHFLPFKSYINARDFHGSHKIFIKSSEDFWKDKSFRELTKSRVKLVNTEDNAMRGLFLHQHHGAAPFQNVCLFTSSFYINTTALFC